MGSLWRSQEMTLAQLFLQAEAAYDTVSCLGELGLVQFRDLNPDTNAFQRKFVNEVRRCDELARKLRFFSNEVERAKLPTDAGPAAMLDESPSSTEMQNMEAEFEQLEREMKEINHNEEALRKQELELSELRAILNKCGQFFNEAETALPSGGDVEPGENDILLDVDRTGQLRNVTGVIARDKLVGFERLLWRACRGNVFLRQVPVDEKLKDPATGEELYKNVFIVFYQGDQLDFRVRKICEGYEASIYPTPSSAVERRELMLGVETRLNDLSAVLAQTTEHRNQVLGNVAYKLAGWEVKVKKIKAIYYTMNKFNIDVTRKCLIAECWCPEKKLGAIQVALREGTDRSGSSVPAILNRVPTKEKPPTYHITNKFTEGFQTIIDAYGVGSYREVNPTPFTIITFPFLFAVMFGDLGHGTIMALAAFYLIYKEDKLKHFKEGGEIWDTMFSGRYLIFMMGLFSMYTGLIYNDVFSKPLNLFGSGWSLAKAEEAPDGGDVHLDLSDFSHAYPIGIDPLWAIATNKLTFLNSMKMKISVILGVGQMTFGVVLSYFNYSFFNKRRDILHVFIPQLIFLLSIFGYLTLMIVYKWANSSFPGNGYPSLLLMLINMFLKPTAVGADQALFGGKEGSGQLLVQQILVVCAVICVPWMLLTKPLLMRAEHNKKKKGKGLSISYERSVRVDSTSSSLSEDGTIQGDPIVHDDHGGHDEEEFEFGEIFVHSAIHTIEFCLGCISNTASYLRLWALSLAHAQLSEVLWSMIFHAGLSNKTSFAPVVLFGAFSFWAVLTIAVLLIMEGLSAFLHALRLHWVEFNNKFYEGDGYKFAPFSFDLILTGKDEEFE